MRRSSAGFWDYAGHATRFNNDLLAPTPLHVLFGHYEGWPTDEGASLQYLKAATARALDG
jgi:hypothetical protein